MHPGMHGQGMPGMHPGMHPGMPMHGGMSAEAELARLKAENAAMKDQMGYQEMSKKLDGMSGIFVKQKLDLLELMTGCDMPNKYEVYAMKDGQKTGRSQFLYTEKSGCCSRMCLPPDCRPLDMSVISEQYGPSVDQEQETVLHIERPCKCTFYCFNRQEMQVNWTEKGQQKYLGKIVDPWDCCHFTFDVKDEDDKDIYKIKANCCQLGFMLPQCPYSACQTINFDIIDPANDSVVGSLVKTGKGYCTSFWAPDYNNFKIEFPKSANWKHKVTLLYSRLLS